MVAKKFLGIFLLFFLPLFFSMTVNSYGQAGAYSKDAKFSPTYPGETVEFQCNVDSLGADTSRTFTLAKYDGVSWTDHPISTFRLLTSAAGTPKISTYIDGSFDGSTWFVVDTLGTDITSESATKSTTSLKNLKYPYYRMRNKGGAANRRDSIIKWIWYLYHKD